MEGCNEIVGSMSAFQRSVPCCRGGANVAVPDFVGVVAAAVEPSSSEPLAVGERSCSDVEVDFHISLNFVYKQDLHIRSQCLPGASPLEPLSESR